jgi:hypothetical protein
MGMRARIRVAVSVVGLFCAFGACGGSRASHTRTTATAGPPPEVLKPLLVPPSPYYLIYSPPVSLAKQPDTTAHGRKPRS